MMTLDQWADELSRRETAAVALARQKGLAVADVVTKDVPRDVLRQLQHQADPRVREAQVRARLAEAHAAADQARIDDLRAREAALTPEEREDRKRQAKTRKALRQIEQDEACKALNLRAKNMRRKP